MMLVTEHLSDGSLLFVLTGFAVALAFVRTAELLLTRARLLADRRLAQALRASISGAPPHPPGSGADDHPVRSTSRSDPACE
jgi:hypothetical protein